MTTISEIIELIEAGEYEHYGLRAHRGDAAAVGEWLGNSRVWVDGDPTDDELGGICAIKVIAGTAESVLATIRKMYAWGGAQIVLVGGYYASYGEDRDEIIIRYNICLAIL